jgi:transposase
MLNLDGRKVFLGVGITDMRKAVNGLALIVEHRLANRLFSGDLFVFCNRKRDVIKVLYWDRNGFCLWQKKLEKERYRWPESAHEVAEVSMKELGWLLEGFDIRQAHKRLAYDVIC